MGEVNNILEDIEYNKRIDIYIQKLSATIVMLQNEKDPIMEEFYEANKEVCLLALEQLDAAKERKEDFDEMEFINFFNDLLNQAMACEVKALERDICNDIEPMKEEELSVEDDEVYDDTLIDDDDDFIDFGKEEYNDVDMKEVMPVEFDGDCIEAPSNIDTAAVRFKRRESMYIKREKETKEMAHTEIGGNGLREARYVEDIKEDIVIPLFAKIPLKGKEACDQILLEGCEYVCDVNGKYWISVDLSYVDDEVKASGADIDGDICYLIDPENPHNIRTGYFVWNGVKVWKIEDELVREEEPDNFISRVIYNVKGFFRGLSEKRKRRKLMKSIVIRYEELSDNDVNVMKGDRNIAKSIK